MKGGKSVKKFIAMLALAAVVFSSIGCGGEAPKKDAPKPAEKDKGKDKA
jgi:hypothetical protein